MFKQYLGPDNRKSKNTGGGKQYIHIRTNNKRVGSRKPKKDIKQWEKEINREGNKNFPGRIKVATTKTLGQYLSQSLNLSEYGLPYNSPPKDSTGPGPPSQRKK